MLLNCDDSRLAFLCLLSLMFDCREDANKAIQRLNGHGYDNLILHVEWAQPRAER